MRDLHAFAINGDQSIVLDGSPGVELHGHLRATHASHICEGQLPTFCEVNARDIQFQITRSKTYFKALAARNA